MVKPAIRYASKPVLTYLIGAARPFCLDAMFHE
jgi:hypothetical protein